MLCRSAASDDDALLLVPLLTPHTGILLQDIACLSAETSPFIVDSHVQTDSSVSPLLAYVMPNSDGKDAMFAQYFISDITDMYEDILGFFFHQNSGINHVDTALFNATPSEKIVQDQWNTLNGWTRTLDSVFEKSQQKLTQLTLLHHARQRAMDTTPKCLRKKSMPVKTARVDKRHIASPSAKVASEQDLALQNTCAMTTRDTSKRLTKSFTSVSKQDKTDTTREKIRNNTMIRHYCVLALQDMHVHEDHAEFSTILSQLQETVCFTLRHHPVESTLLTKQQILQAVNTSAAFLKRIL